MIKILSHILLDITVEPALFFYLISYTILETVNTNLFLQKACRFNTTLEPDLNTPCDDERRGVLYASEVSSICKFIVVVASLLYSIVTTCWSDESGKRRRPLIYLPIAALIFQNLSGSLHSYFWHWTPIKAAISDIMLEMCTGGVIMVHTMCSIYLCDITDADSRTMRMGMLAAVKMIAGLIGNGAVGFILRCFGFFYTYLISAALASISLMFALMFVRDNSIPVDKKKSCWKFFNLKSIVDGFKIVFKKSLGRNRVIVSLLLAISIIVMFLTYGERTVFYLFLRYKFHWDEKRFSSYILYRSVIVIIGTVFCSVVLSKCLKIHDGLIGAFAVVCDTIAVIGYIFASENWHLYLIPIFDAFHGTAMSVSVSFFSKFYESNETGRLYAVLHVFAVIVPLCHPTYNYLFQKTLDFFPAAFFIVSAVLNVVVVLLYSTTYALNRKSGRNPNC